MQRPQPRIGVQRVPRVSGGDWVPRRKSDLRPGVGLQDWSQIDVPREWPHTLVLLCLHFPTLRTPRKSVTPLGDRTLVCTNGRGPRSTHDLYRDGTSGNDRLFGIWLVDGETWRQRSRTLTCLYKSLGVLVCLWLYLNNSQVVKRVY